jgi:hypothetical protein
MDTNGDAMNPKKKFRRQMVSMQSLLAKPRTRKKATRMSTSYAAVKKEV